MTAINSPPLCRGGRIFTDFTMCNCFSKNLGLKEAAKRDVGTGANQMPDMSAWQKSASGRIKWRRFPDGTLIQVGISSAGLLGAPVNVTLPISFGDASYGVVASYDNARVGTTTVPGFAALPVSGSQFALMCDTPTTGNAQFAYWIAIGD